MKVLRVYLLIILFIFAFNGPHNVGTLSLASAKDDKVAILIKKLKHKDVKIREEAAETLGELKDPRAVEPLIKALKDKDSRVRSEAAIALGKLRDPRAVEPLIEALKDKDPEVPPNADYALREITGQDFGVNPEKWQKWWEENKGRFIKGK
jgi:vesicle coat complex subunit